jgi:diaminopimelate epimerase
MEIPFWKMHGASNDFILVDDRSLTFPADDHDWIAAVARRRTGVGAEGIILIQPSQHADFRMRFFNPDGGEVEMCGNGARCVARLAAEIGAAPARMSIETAAGLLRAEARGDQALLSLTDPRDWRMNRTLAINGEEIRYHFVNSGVPHVVVEVRNLEAVNVPDRGARIRRHPAFAPAGTNANFIEATGPNALRVRTYERGVEAETLACGTGIVASALVAARLGRVSPPVRVTPASGDLLEVGFERKGDTVSGVTLLGPARHVFQGRLAYPGAA